MNDTDRTHKENKLEQDITLPYLKKAVIFSITFGFFGVNMAFALQSAMMGRIFQTLGAKVLTPLNGNLIKTLCSRLLILCILQEISSLVFVEFDYYYSF